MTDNNYFDPKIFQFTMVFPTVSDITIYNSPPVPPSTVAVLRIQPSVDTKLPAVIEVSLQLLKNSTGSCSSTFDVLYVVGISISANSKIGLLSNSSGPAANTVDAIGISLFSAGA